MNFLKYTFIISFIFITNSYAGVNDYIKISKDTKLNFNGSDLNKTVENLTKSTKDDLTKKLDSEFQKLQDKASNTMDKALMNFNTKIDDLDKRVNNNIINKGEQLISKAESELDNLIAIKHKVSKYVLIAKIFISILFLGIFVLIFFIWKAYKKFKNSILSTAMNIGGHGGNLALEKKFESIETKLNNIITKLETIKKG